MNTISTNCVTLKTVFFFGRKLLETSYPAFAVKTRNINWGILNGSSGLWPGTHGMNQPSYHWFLISKLCFLRSYLLFFLDRWSVIFSLLFQCILQQCLQDILHRWCLIQENQIWRFSKFLAISFLFLFETFFFFNYHYFNSFIFSDELELQSLSLNLSFRA